MTCSRRSVVLLAVLAIAAPWFALGQSPDDEREQNRLLLDRIRTDRDRYAGLLNDLRTFNRLPADRRERLRRMDRDLQNELSGTQVRLLRAGERYVAWLQRLSAADRGRVEGEPDKMKRLATIWEIRARQWLERQPPAVRERVGKGNEVERQNRIRQLRADERRRQHLWRLAGRHWDEVQNPAANVARDLPAGVRRFIDEFLLPQLSPYERQQLDEAADTALYPYVLVALADKHPVVLPGPTTGPSRPQDLPPRLADTLGKLGPAAQTRLREAEGKWPDFAMTVMGIVRLQKVPLAKQLGPSRPAEFSPQWRQVIDRLTKPDGPLSAEEKQALSQAEGHWPLYPRRLLGLAVKYQVALAEGAPLHLPGGPQRWARFRERPVEDREPSMVSDAVLREFARTELSPDERLQLGASLTDAASRNRLQQAYVKRHPDEWLKIQLSDQQKKLRR